MKVSGGMISLMDMENKFMRQDQNMKVILLMGKNMEKGNIYGRNHHNIYHIQVHGKIMKCMDLVHLNVMMVEYI